MAYRGGRGEIRPGRHFKGAAQKKKRKKKKKEKKGKKGRKKKERKIKYGRSM